MVNKIDPVEMLRQIKTQAPPVQSPRINLAGIKLVLTALPNVAQELKVLRPFGMFNPLVIWSAEIKGERLRYSSMQCYKLGDYITWGVDFRNTGNVPLACILKYGGEEEEIILAGRSSVVKRASFGVTGPKKILLDASIAPREKPLSLLFAGDTRTKRYSIGILSWKDKPLSQYPMPGAVNFDYTSYGNYDDFVSVYNAGLKPEGTWSKSTWKVEFGGVSRERDIYDPINNILYRQPDTYVSISVQATVEVTQAARVIPALVAMAFYEDGYHTSGFAWQGERGIGSEVKVVAGESKTIVFDRMDLPVELYGKLLLLPHLTVWRDDYKAVNLLGPGQYGYLGGELLAP